MQPRYYKSTEPTETEYEKKLKKMLGDSIDQMLYS